uniref:Uncharacterized protein n=1 Tax=Seriola lalandi dorsalis TaxID=1841481 RepID=A0A3B4XAA5_SERLL
MELTLKPILAEMVIDIQNGAFLWCCFVFLFPVCVCVCMCLSVKNNAEWMRCYSQVVFTLTGKRVTEVKTDIFVTSIGPVSDHDMVRLFASVNLQALQKRASDLYSVHWKPIKLIQMSHCLSFTTWN